MTLQENNGIAVVDLAARRDPQRVLAGNRRPPTASTRRRTRSSTDRLARRRAARARRARLGRRRPTSPPPTRATGRAAPAAGSIFDIRTGEVVWDAGNSFEQIAIAHGVLQRRPRRQEGRRARRPRDRRVRRHAATRSSASERSNIVVVYDLSDPTSPEFVQMLSATNGPEGILPIPSRDLLVVSSETDDASVGVRAAVNVYELGGGRRGPAEHRLRCGRRRRRSAGARSARSRATRPTRARSSPRATTRLKPPTHLHGRRHGRRRPHHRLARRHDRRASRRRSTSRASSPVRRAGTGSRSRAPRAPRTRSCASDADGAVVADRRSCPPTSPPHLGKWGLEGVDRDDGRRGRRGRVRRRAAAAVDRPVGGAGPIDGEGVTRIGRYDVATGAWTWFGYQLEATDVAGRLARPVRDHRGRRRHPRGDRARQAQRPGARRSSACTPSRSAGSPVRPASEPRASCRCSTSRSRSTCCPSCRRRTAGRRRSSRASPIGSDGQVYAVTDNDGLKDATGETVFLRLGSAADLF